MKDDGSRKRPSEADKKKVDEFVQSLMRPCTAPLIVWAKCECYPANDRCPTEVKCLRN